MTNTALARVGFAAFLSITFFIGVLIPKPSHGEPAPAESFLSRFKKSPRAAMNESPRKIGAINQDFLQEKTNACRRSRSRQMILEQYARESLLIDKKSKIAKHPSSAIKMAGVGNENPKIFLESSAVIQSIYEMDKTMRSATSEIVPWSGDYWAIRSGGAAKRYKDPEFKKVSFEWQTAFDYITQFPALSIDKSLYSPAEKYDFIVRDQTFSLTAAGWNEGKAYNDEFGSVEGWMGLCHGWAPASFMEPRPTHKFTAQSLNDENETIEFFPDDVKALLTLKWAKGVLVTQDFLKSGTRFIGGRCDVTNPEQDPETGRIIDPKCFDLNPGSWHMVVTNHLATEKRPLIIDAAFDYEVWNQPVVKYSYSYFNPKTMTSTGEISEAIVLINDPEFKDTFTKFRKNPKAVSVVGIIMDVTYTIESVPHGYDTDDETHDFVRTVQYHYDLELDANGKVVGGEWYNKSHPDFVWMPIKEAIAVNQEDLHVRSNLDAIETAPSASKQNVPLRWVLDYLKSNRE
jgi:hypothetical protein